MAELIPFAVPTASDKTLLVWDLNSGPTAEALHVSRGRGKEGGGSVPADLVPDSRLSAAPRGLGPAGTGGDAGLGGGGGGSRPPRRRPPGSSPGAARSRGCAELGSRGRRRSAPPRAGPPQRSLFTALSRFGLLHSLRVLPNAAVARPGFYAVVKFYSARDARRAQKACDGRPLVQSAPVKVHLGSRHKAVRYQTLPLNSTRCQELANYYFGFNGWSKRIIKLRELSDLEGREAGPLGKQSLRFLCAVEVALPSYQCRSPGFAVVEEPVEELEEGLTALVMKRKVARKLAVQKALLDAFQKLCIVVLESGKIAVEYRPREETRGARSEAELQDFVQVGCFAWEQHSQGEEDFRDFNVEEEELGLLEQDQPLT